VSKTTVGASGAAGSVLLSVSADGALSELKKWKVWARAVVSAALFPRIREVVLVFIAGATLQEPSAFAAVPGTDGAEAMRVSYADVCSDVLL
jgi:hypothetical protein